MKIETLKDLEAMLKVCRKQGVLAIKVDGIELTIGDAPETKAQQKDSDIKVDNQYENEDLLFWSSADRT